MPNFESQIPKIYLIIFSDDIKSSGKTAIFNWLKIEREGVRGPIFD